MSKLNRYLVELFPVKVKSFRPLSRTALTLPSGSFRSDSALCSFYMNKFNTCHNHFTVVNISFVGYWIKKNRYYQTTSPDRSKAFAKVAAILTVSIRASWRKFKTNFFYINPFSKFNNTHNMVKIIFHLLRLTIKM